ncbi:12303_t:CDS:2 [Acaulospora colombiana]|uniref:12303_t:CDS:1 n=1 Tax=Acaulospora colombiana TaxID=27376 RepID=A0ACA9N8A7_9GLOM|nr:12303_t:CDS:2 [Acaulospora colombiana]
MSQIDKMSTQDNWRWCNKCQGLFYHGSGNGVCPVGGSHNPDTSGDYKLKVEANPGSNEQNNWRWCKKCQSLAYDGSGTPVDSSPSGAGATAAKDSSTPRLHSALRATTTIPPEAGTTRFALTLEGIKTIGAGATSARLSATLELGGSGAASVKLCVMLSPPMVTLGIALLEGSTIIRVVASIPFPLARRMAHRKDGAGATSAKSSITLLPSAAQEQGPDECFAKRRFRGGVKRDEAHGQSVIRCLNTPTRGASEKTEVLGLLANNIQINQEGKEVWLFSELVVYPAASSCTTRS